MSSSPDELSFKEKLQTLQFTKVKGGSRPRTGTKTTANPAWERGIVTETRVDGSQMPLLYEDDGLKPLRMKKAAEERHVINAQLDKLNNDPNVFKKG